MTVASAAHAAVHRLDYRPPDWLVPEIALAFVLNPARTRVSARLEVRRNGAHDRPLVLDGDGLTLLAVRIDGVAIDDPRRDDQGRLILPLAGDAHVVDTEVDIAPGTNSQLMGLYASGDLLCTQCEAEGFRRITFFPDRPDVLSRYRVRMTADRTQYPVLLANGDPVAHGDHEDGTHWAEWHDPWPKPCYLFALVAGPLVANQDRFTTRSGREVKLGIWVRPGDEARTHHAMAALKASMRWDEQVYGREYDLDRFNIVAVADFNFGAMENKGLNIFNARYILADPQTATDMDYDGVLAVVAHEYFHNWSGNRVTCRDWFQLSLKEGFTVFRDQQFSADQGSAAVRRIEDVRTLRAVQFPEDAGPLAHPVRPDSYIEISNFYTATIYNKGAELIRMIHTMLGPDRFRAGSDLYFDRHDGQAATCDDFTNAMADGGHIDLAQFRRWYQTAGTPHVKVACHHGQGTATLTLRQELNGRPATAETALVIPLRMALFDRESGTHRGEQLVILDAPERTFAFSGWATPPVLSINRGFSAPVIIEQASTTDDQAFLSAHDDDPFARYEALQQLMLDTIQHAVRRDLIDPVVETAHARSLIRAIGHTLADEHLDPAFIAEAAMLPAETMIGDRMDPAELIDPDAIARTRDTLRTLIGLDQAPRLRTLIQLGIDAPYAYTPEAKGQRRLRGLALGYIAAAFPEEGAGLAFARYQAADNMTDQLSALGVLANGMAPEREIALADFYERWKQDPLVIDKWFSVQALSLRSDVVAQVKALTTHRDYNPANPNRFRSLIGAFSVNPRAFHRADGAGYHLVAEATQALDPINPQTAARMIAPFGRWRRFAPERQQRMKAALESILGTPGLSRDTYEQVSKTLG